MTLDEKGVRALNRWGNKYAGLLLVEGPDGNPTNTYFTCGGGRQARVLTHLSRCPAKSDDHARTVDRFRCRTYGSNTGG
jgi:hypothetical protein